MANRVFIVCVLVASAGCSNKISGDLELNGKRLVIDSCRNGKIYNFRGVELVGQDGTRLRIAATQTGEGDVAVLPPGGTGKQVGPCGRFEISDQNSEINDVKNVEGSATLDCKLGDVTIKGTVTFGNCH
jgi:hypothetical protein